MAKYLVIYDIGYGEQTEVVELENPSGSDLEDAAYEVWKEHAENNANYRAELLTKELADNYGEEFEE